MNQINTPIYLIVLDSISALKSFSNNSHVLPLIFQVRSSSYNYTEATNNIRFSAHVSISGNEIADYMDKRNSDFSVPIRKNSSI